MFQQTPEAQRGTCHTTCVCCLEESKDPQEDCVEDILHKDGILEATILDEGMTHLVIHHH